MVKRQLLKFLILIAQNDDNKIKYVRPLRIGAGVAYSSPPPSSLALPHVAGAFVACVYRLVQEDVLVPLAAHIDLEQLEIHDVILAMSCLMEVRLEPLMPRKATHPARALKRHRLA